MLERLGAGGMGEVFLAYDDRLDRKVAIKRIRPEADARPEARERFRREARLAAQLSHPAIVQVHDIVQEGESDYLVMEYVDGRTLRDRLRQGPLAPGEAVRIALELTAGLETAHREGIVHRDLKTENVLVTPAGGVKIMDFGIAKRFTGGEGETSLTGDHAAIGTCRAMSPEQARGEPVDHRTDLFSLGVLLYEALTGTSPFEAESPVATLTRVVQHRQTPVSDLDPAIPQPLSSLVDRLLEKKALLRPRNAGEVRRDLEEIDLRAPAEGATADEATWAEPTVPRRRVPDPSPPVPKPAPEIPEKPRSKPFSFRSLFFGITIPLMAALALSAALLDRGARDLSALTEPVSVLPPASERSTIAVLRFRDRSASGESAWMGTALPEMITRFLAAGGNLRVVARREIPEAERDLRLAGLEGLAPYHQRLDVDYLVSGSFERSGDDKLFLRFVVSDRSQGRRFYSAILPGSSQALLDLSREVADAVRRELRLPLLGTEARKTVEAAYADLPVEAQSLYFSGLGHYYSGNDQKAAELFAEAGAAAPRSPLPRAARALAVVYTPQAADAARDACEATALSQALPPHEREEAAALCDEFSGRLDEARRVYRRLLRENPREQARYRLKLAKLDMNDRGSDRSNDALNTLEELKKADPATLRRTNVLNADLYEAELLYRKDRLDEAVRLARQAAEGAGAINAFGGSVVARSLEGKSLVALKDFRGATGPLQEACRRFAESNQESRAAECRENLVMARFFADRTPLYELLEQNRALYTRSNNLRGLGKVAQIEAVLRQEQGDHKEARRLFTEADDLFARAGAGEERAWGRLGMGIQLLFLGRLQESEELLDQAYAWSSRTGDLASQAGALWNLGEIYFLRGDLRKARTAFESAPSGDASQWLALIDAAEGRFPQALQSLQALLSRTKRKDPDLAVKIELALGDLLLTEGRLAEALSFARRAERNLAGNQQQDLATLSRLLMAKILLAQKDFAAADEKFETIREPAGRSMDYRVTLDSGITAARLKGALGGSRRMEEALAELAKIETDCTAAGNVIYAFEARLASAGLMTAPEKRERLKKIAQDARRLGLERIARRAEREAREG